MEQKENEELLLANHKNSSCSATVRHNNGFVYGVVFHCQRATACMEAAWLPSSASLSTTCPVCAMLTYLLEECELALEIIPQCILASAVRVKTAVITMLCQHKEHSDWLFFS